MTRDTLLDEQGIPLIQGRDAEPGKRMKKPQPRKAQRGQKKKKKPAEPAGSSEPAAESSSTQNTRKKAPKKQELPAFETVQNGTISAAVISPKLARARMATEDRNAAVSTPDQSRIEQVIQRQPTRPTKIVPQSRSASAVNLRERDIAQLKRRYAAALTEEGDKLSLPFTPSDPDFPYDVPNLVISLHVPEEYPAELVELTIKSGLEVGFARNVEREFEAERVGVASGRGLLGMITWLDRNLERLLALRKSETVKVVRHRAAAPVPQESESSSSDEDEGDHDAYRLPIKFWTFEEKKAAAATRAEELSRLTSRLKPTNTTTDSFDFQLEFDSLRLHVPKLYPLEPAWLLVLQGNELIEAPANAELAKGSRELIRQMNWIAANAKTLASQEQQERALMDAQHAAERHAFEKAQAAQENPEPWRADHDGFKPVEGHNYSVPEHVSEVEEDLVEPEAELEQLTLQDTTTQAARGTAINCTLSMQSIASLQASNISLLVKCLRCKATNVPATDVSASQPLQMACPQCLGVMTIRFRPLLMHVSNAKRLGYLDLDCCVATSFSLVTLKAICAECPVPEQESMPTEQTFSGVGAGQFQSKPCRQCHGKLQIELKDPHFLVLSALQSKPSKRLNPAVDVNPAALPKGARKDALRQARKHKGQSLPDFGICRHYRRSFRWFRFPCCRRVFACDQCHDLLAGASSTVPASSDEGTGNVAVAGLAQGKHRHELARFQICGFCSTETAVNREANCTACGASLVKAGSAPGTQGSGFWEGGEGTRDQTLMNRRDPRKHRKKI